MTRPAGNPRTQKNRGAACSHRSYGAPQPTPGLPWSAPHRDLVPPVPAAATTRNRRSKPAPTTGEPGTPKGLSIVTDAYSESVGPAGRIEADRGDPAGICVRRDLPAGLLGLRCDAARGSRTR